LSEQGEARAFFGRRKGHKLRPYQAGLLADRLPRLRIEAGREPVDPRDLFSAPVEAVWLEIGFGGGEHLAARARQNPQIGLIGCEPFMNGTAKLLAAIAAQPLTTVRIFDGDALALLPRLPEASIDQVFLLYPDPWPKRRQRKRRFVSQASLTELARVVRPGGLFLFASDIDDYIGWTLARVLASPDWFWTAERPGDWREPFADWPGTRYEAKAKREGRASSYLTIQRR
jgi:tRNA (guanine-N7-)-methyltransferase